MSAELMQELASLGISTKEAAQRAGMTYHTFRTFRLLHPEIKWPLTPAAREGLKARWKASPKPTKALR
ncbi:MAG: hypothetical protein K2Y25_14850 [Pseudomonadaceae bacterium]|nr:hypothetical protein [Pseudomonadaceae bacterium]